MPGRIPKREPGQAHQGNRALLRTLPGGNLKVPQSARRRAQRRARLSAQPEAQRDVQPKAKPPAENRANAAAGPGAYPGTGVTSRAP